MSINHRVKTALVTGGGRGIGKEIAYSLGRDGVNICITYNTDEASALNVVDQLQTLDVKAHALQLDLAATKNIDTFVKQFADVLKRWGNSKLDYLINNAGIILHKPFSNLAEDEIDRMFNINYKSVFFLTQALLAHINDGGRIINLGTGLTRFTFPQYVAYAPIKSAIETLTKYLAADLGARGITVNCVAPGAIDTEMNKEVFENHPQVKQLISSHTTLGRVGIASDIGGVVSFLCSEKAAWITGQRLETSGGAFL